jgi:hypothetical protein
MELNEYFKLHDGEAARILFNDWGALLWLRSLELQPRETTRPASSDYGFDARLRLHDSGEIESHCCIELIFLDVENFSFLQTDRRIAHFRVAYEPSQDGSALAVARWDGGLLAARWAFTTIWSGVKTDSLPNAWPKVPQ